MSLPIRHLPVLQNWDCHVCGSCCKEYLVTITDEERRRIEAQGWDQDAEIGDLPLFQKSGPWWARRYHLTRRGDGSCVFLTDKGRCRIHERFGYAAKPLPCRLFPFLLVPAGDHWRVGMRFACPSAAANKGRAVAEHEETLRQFAAELARREGVVLRPGDDKLAAPPLQKGQRVEWPELLRFVHALLTILRNRNDRMERRLRKCLTLAHLCRQARFDQIQGGRLTEFLKILVDSLEAEVPTDPATVAAPRGRAHPVPAGGGAVHAQGLRSRKWRGPARPMGTSGGGVAFRRWPGRSAAAAQPLARDDLRPDRGRRRAAARGGGRDPGAVLHDQGGIAAILRPDQLSPAFLGRSGNAAAHRRGDSLGDARSGGPPAGRGCAAGTHDRR